MSKPRLTAEQKIVNAAARSAKRVLAKWERVAALMGPETAAYWRGSVSASVMADVANGRLVVVGAKEAA